MSNHLCYIKLDVDFMGDSWVRELMRENGGGFVTRWLGLLAEIKNHGKGDALDTHLDDFSAKMMLSKQKTLAFLSKLDSKSTKKVKYSHSVTGKMLRISATGFSDFQHNLGRKDTARGYEDDGKNPTDQSRPDNIRPEGVPSKGVESETKTKTPPTQSIIKDAKPATQAQPIPGRRMITTPDGVDRVFTRFDLWPPEGKTVAIQPEQAGPPPLPALGRTWRWTSSWLCWYSDILDDNKSWFSGIPAARWDRMSFERQRDIELEARTEGENNVAEAQRAYYAEASRREKITNDADGTTERRQAAYDEQRERLRRERAEADKPAPSKPSAHGKTTPAKVRKFFK